MCNPNQGRDVNRHEGPHLTVSFIALQGRVLEHGGVSGIFGHAHGHGHGPGGVAGDTCIDRLKGKIIKESCIRRIFV